MRRTRGRQRSGPVARTLGRVYLRLVGWRVDGEMAAGVDAAVVVAAPHTSNWDMPLMLAVAFTLGFRPRWLGKHQMFRRPFGGFMRWLGGIPVNRSSPHGLVDQTVAAFAASGGLMLVIPPSGTRAKRAYWKSGFYHIARQARVPIVLSYLDYRRRVGGIGPVLVPSGDLAADMDVVRAFYATVTPRHPAQAASVRLVEEDAPTAATGGA
jgi:1-acyl-sn-glycerol-3-phosphate acyltransferase